MVQSVDGTEIFGFQLVNILRRTHAGFDRANPLPAAPNVTPSLSFLIAA